MYDHQDDDLPSLGDALRARVLGIQERRTALDRAMRAFDDAWGKAADEHPDRTAEDCFDRAGVIAALRTMSNDITDVLNRHRTNPDETEALQEIHFILKSYVRSADV